MPALPHVVHIIDELPPDGAERLLVDLLRHRSAQFHFSVICLIKGGELEHELRDMGVPVIILGRRGKFDVSLLWRLVRELRQQKAAVVHTHLFTADFFGRLAARIAAVPAVYSTIHSTNLWKSRVHRFLDWLLAPLATSVIACTAEVGEVLHHRDHIARKRITVIPNGIDLGRFERASASGVREEFDIAEQRPLLGVVGRLHPAKGHDDLLQALAQLPSLPHKPVCLLIGSGELHDALTHKVHELQLDDVVIFAGQRRDVPRLLAALDVLLMPSRWEGLPMALLEAMAVSKAIIATRVGGIPDVIHDRENGLLINAGDVSALRDAITTLVTDSALRQRLGDNACTHLHQHYNVVNTARAYENLYRTALRLPQHDEIKQHA